jgi:stress response protein SCP2
MENTHIKRATLIDILQLQKIGKQTFYETFSAENSREDMDKYLSERFSTEALTAELNHKNSEFYFSILGNKINGYLKLTMDNHKQN